MSLVLLLRSAQEAGLLCGGRYQHIICLPWCDAPPQWAADRRITSSTQPPPGLLMEERTWECLYSLLSPALFTLENTTLTLLFIPQLFPQESGGATKEGMERITSKTNCVLFGFSFNSSSASLISPILSCNSPQVCASCWQWWIGTKNTHEYSYNPVTQYIWFCSGPLHIEIITVKPGGTLRRLHCVNIGFLQ